MSIYDDAYEIQEMVQYGACCADIIDWLEERYYSNAWLLRKQAEAVEDVYEGAAGFETDEEGVGFVWASDIKDYAQRLRQQAAERY